MFESVVNQFSTMSMGEEIYTICFTAFLVGGALCCCRRCDLGRTQVPRAEPQAAPQPQAAREEPRRGKHIRSRPMSRPMACMTPRRTVVVPRLRPAPHANPRGHAAA